MATQVQFRRGTTAQNASFTGALGEVTVDTDKDTLVVHDGGTAGGFEISRADASNLKFPDGAVGTPAISFSSDTNTGIYRGGTDILKFVTAGTDAITIDASQNVDVNGTVTSDGLNVLAGNGVIGTAQINKDNDGLGGISGVALTLANDGTSAGTGVSLRLSPADVQTAARGSLLSSTLEGTNGSNIELWTVVNGQSPHKSMEIDGNGDISFYEDTGTTPKFFWDASEETLGIGLANPTSELTVGGNASTTYTPTVSISDTISGATMAMRGQSPKIAFDVTSSGVPKILMDNAGLEFKTGTLDAEGDVDVKIDSSGNVGIGTSSPSSFTAENDSKLVVGTGGGNSAITIYTGTASRGGLFFADGTSGAATYAGILRYDHSDNAMLFYTNGLNERMRIDSSGNLMVGKSAVDLDVAGVEFRAGSYNGMTNDGGVPLYLNRLTSDGGILEFRKDGTTVGSIGTFSAGNTYFKGGSTTHSVGAGDTGVQYEATNDQIRPYNISTGLTRTDAIDIGGLGARFKDLYLSGGVYIGGTGSANHLDDYEEGTWTPTQPTVGFSSATGNYTKIGNTVISYFDVTWNSNSSSVDAIVRGLPFVGGGNALSSSSIMYTDYGAANLYFYDSTTPGAKLVNTTGTDLSCQNVSTKNFKGMVVYQVS